MTVTPNLPLTSTCAPWAQISDIPVDTSGFDAGILTNCLQMASDLLYSLTGSRYAGSCQDIVRPCSRWTAQDHGRPIRPAYFNQGFYPGTGDGYWAPDPSLFGWCACNSEEQSDGLMLPSVNLGVFPLTGIEQVLIDGTVVDPTTYVISNNRSLVRLAPDPVTANPGWPTSNRHDLTSDQVGTWEVTLDYGIPPPIGGVLSCAEYALNLFRAFVPGSGDCQLPGYVTQITRQGVTAVMANPMQLLVDGMTGLRLCDSWINASNPAHLRRRATVWIPEHGRRVRRNGPVG